MTFTAVLFTKFSGLFPDGISWIYVLAFHGMVWTWLPLVKRKKSGMYSVPVYFSITIVVFLIFGIWVYPMKPWAGSDWETFYGLFLFFGYLHIFSSIVLSRYNPRSVVRFFGYVD